MQSIWGCLIGPSGRRPVSGRKPFSNASVTRTSMSASVLVGYSCRNCRRRAGRVVAMYRSRDRLAPSRAWSYSAARSSADKLRGRSVALLGCRWVQALRRVRIRARVSRMTRPREHADCPDGQRSLASNPKPTDSSSSARQKRPPGVSKALRLNRDPSKKVTLTDN